MFAVLVSCLLLPVMALAKPDAPRQWEITIQGVRVPAYIPAWGNRRPLASITDSLADGDRSGAVARLERLLAEYRGELILPPEKLPPETHGIIRIPPPEQILADWFHALGTESSGLVLSPERLRWQAAPMAGVNPVLWHPNAREEARLAFDSAVEAGDFATALKILRSPNRPTNLDPDLQRWLVRRIPADRAGDDAPFVSSYPHDGGPSYELPARLESLYTPPEGGADLFDPTPGEPRRITDPILTRRTPLNAIYPLIGKSSVILSTGSRALEISTTASPRLLWEWSPGGKRGPPPILNPIVPVMDGDSLAIVLGTGLTTSPMTYIVARDLEKSPPPSIPPQVLPPSWNELVLLRRTGGSEGLEMDPSPLARALRANLSGWNIPGPPLFLPHTVLVPACKGFEEVRLSLFAFDRRSGKLLWKHYLGTRPLPWNSQDDLRGVIPRVSLTPFGGDVLVSHGEGWLARIDLHTGDYEGAIFYDRYGLEDVPGNRHSGPRLKSHWFRRLAAPRPRYPGQDFVLPATDSHGPLYIVLPPDARHLMAIDLTSWEVVWQHPDATSGIGPQTMVLGIRRGLVWILDAGIPQGQHSLELSALDAETGKLERAVRLELEATPPLDPKTGRPDSDAPLLVGVPRLVGDDLWVPTRKGIELWSLGDLEDEPQPPLRVTPWPPGAGGGTPIPLPGGRILTVNRGDAGLGTPGSVRILGPAEN